MELETALYTYLLAHSGLSALISDRFYWDVASQGAAFPYVVGQMIDNVFIHTHSGQESTEEPNYQITAYGSTRASARAVAEQIKAALCDFKGTMGGVTIQYITLQNEIALTETKDNGAVDYCSVDLEYQIVYERID